MNSKPSQNRRTLDILAERLFTALSENADMQQLLDLAGDIVGNPFAIGQPDFEVRYVSSEMPKDSINAFVGTMQRFDDETIRAILENAAKSNDPVVSSPHGTYNSIVAALRQNGHIIGYIANILSKRPLSQDDVEAVDLTRMTIELALERNTDAGFIPTDTISRLLNELFFHDAHSHLAISASELGIRRWPLRIVACLSSQGYTANAPPRASRDALCDFLDSRLFLSLPGQLIFLTNKDVFPIKKEFSDLLKSHNLAAGVSYPYYSLHQTGIRYRQTRAAAQRAVDEGVPTVFYTEFAAHHLISMQMERQKLLEICPPPVIRLIEYDQAHGTSLCKTLTVYLSSGYNMVKTTKILAVHKNTVQNRLSRIQELLKDYSFCLDSLFVIYLCLKYLMDTGNDELGGDSF